MFQFLQSAEFEPGKFRFFVFNVEWRRFEGNTKWRRNFLKECPFSRVHMSDEDTNSFGTNEFLFG